MPDLSTLRAEDHSPAHWEEAKRIWPDRARTEFRSIQIMNRFLGDVLASGDPLDVYAGCHDMVLDEIRHVALTRAVCEKLGAPAVFPSPIPLELSDAFEKAPPQQRALTTAIGMLAINETISVALIADLQARCDYAPIRAVLDATLADEAEHEEFGWEFVRSSLKRFPETARGMWRQVVQQALEQHRKESDAALANVPEEKRSLDAWPDEGRIRLGLFSRERQSLVFEKVYRETLAPKLLGLGLL
jgi:hypothetical protein